MKTTIQAFFLLLMTMPAFSKGEGNVLSSKRPITWLGLDFALARMIGVCCSFVFVRQLFSLTGPSCKSIK